MFQRTQPSRRGIRAIASVVFILLVAALVQVSTSSFAQAQSMVDGDVTLDAAPAGGGLVEVRVTVTNSGSDAKVTVDSIQLPTEAAATAQCRGERSNGSTQTVGVSTDGSLSVGGGTISMPGGSSILFACRFDATDLCGLNGSASATWADPLSEDFTRSASGPVTPPCPEPEVPEAATTSGGPIIVLHKEPSVGSAPFGSTITWTLTAQNVGTRALTQVQVIDPLHAGLTYVPGSASGTAAYDEDTRTLVLRIGRVPVGQTVTATFETRIGAISLIPNIATVVSAQGATAFAESGVFGLPEVEQSTIVPAAAPDEERPRARADRRDRPQLAFTGTETTVLAILGASLVVAGGLTVAASRRFS